MYVTNLRGYKKNLYSHREYVLYDWLLNTTNKIIFLLMLANKFNFYLVWKCNIIYNRNNYVQNND